MKYKDLKIKSADLDHIKELSYEFDIDYEEADIDLETGDVTSNILWYIFNTAINKSDFPDNIKEILEDNIFLNYIDSCIDYQTDDEEVQDFINRFKI